MDKDLMIESLTKQVADLTALVQTLTASNAALTETIKELKGDPPNGGSCSPETHSPRS